MTNQQNVKCREKAPPRTAAKTQFNQSVKHSNCHLHLHLGHLADAFVQSDLQ